MLILKLVTVPIFIATVTLVGRRWGSGVAGIFGGLPIVAGPIVVLVALEQGKQFGAVAATSAMSAVAGLLAFGVSYCWASVRWEWPAALVCSIGAWGIVAVSLAALPELPGLALAVAIMSLILAPFVLPKSDVASVKIVSLSDLPHRMLTGALLTLVVTSVAASIGEVWSGILAVFPVIGLVLAVFTHRSQGAFQVAHVFQGMVRGLYSFVGFFMTLAKLWPHAEFWSACSIAVCVSVSIQAVMQWQESLKN